MHRRAKEEAHVIWWDNFSKLKAYQIPNVDKGTYNQMLWTGKAVRVPRQTASMKCILDDITGGVVPAMPEDPFATRGELTAFFKGVVGGDTMSRHATCLTTKFNVSSVPLTPDVTKLVDANHVESVMQRHTAIDNLCTDSIDPRNIGSKKGFLSLMKEHCSKELQYEDLCKRYSVFNLDIDIFNSSVKVIVVVFCCYCASHKYGKLLRANPFH